MAQSVFASHKQHSARCQVMHRQPVMAGAAKQFFNGITDFLNGGRKVTGKGFVAMKAALGVNALRRYVLQR